MADLKEPASRADAEEFLSRILPLAAAANPKFRSGDSSDLWAWLINRVQFSPGSEPQGVAVTMNEQAFVYRAGAQAAVHTHEVTFAIGDVHINEYAYPADTAENGEKAVGVMFKCRSGKCIKATWDGVTSASDATDLYVYDAAVRGQILRAFALLQ